MSTISPSDSVLQLNVQASHAIDKLVTTANAPEIAMSCAAKPSVTKSSIAMDVSKLTGMNSEEISVNTHSLMAKTPFQ